MYTRSACDWFSGCRGWLSNTPKTAAYSIQYWQVTSCIGRYIDSGCIFAWLSVRDRGMEHSNALSHALLLCREHSIFRTYSVHGPPNVTGCGEEPGVADWQIQHLFRARYGIHTPYSGYILRSTLLSIEITRAHENAASDSVTHANRRFRTLCIVTYCHAGWAHVPDVIRLSVSSVMIEHRICALCSILHIL